MCNKDLNLNDFLMHGTFDHNSIIIGQKLAEKLNLQLNDYVTLLNYSKNTINKFELLKIKVSGIYSTNIPSFDEYSIYGYTEMLQDFLDVKTAGYTTIVGQDKNYNFYNTKSINLNIDNYFSIDFDERHNFFLKWLNVYDVPIKLLLFFVFIISLINTISTSYLDILNRKNDIKKLYIIGYSRCFLKKIFLYKNIILSIFSLCFSIVLSFLFFSIQERFNLINIPSDIYFINKLPFNYDYLFLFTVLIFIFFVNIISSYLSISKIFKNTFFNSMSYD